MDCRVKVQLFIFSLWENILPNYRKKCKSSEEEKIPNPFSGGQCVRGHDGRKNA